MTDLSEYCNEISYSIKVGTFLTVWSTVSFLRGTLVSVVGMSILEVGKELCCHKRSHFLMSKAIVHQPYLQKGKGN